MADIYKLLLVAYVSGENKERQRQL